jgi:transcription termination/antitermination protein NusG
MQDNIQDQEEQEVGEPAELTNQLAAETTSDDASDQVAADDSVAEQEPVVSTPTVTVAAAVMAETKWYVLRVVNGKERKVKEYLDLEIRRNQWGHLISQVLCPMEKIVKMQAGKRSERERILYPGYIMLEAAKGKLDDNLVSKIAALTGVIHFLGKENPVSLRKSEVNKMFGKMDEVAEMGGQATLNFLVGEIIKITDGPFNDFNGTIQEINEEKKKLKVEVKIFGRSQPVELNYIQVEKVS